MLSSKRDSGYALFMVDHHLDTTGLLCPLPVLKLRKRLMALNAGDRMHLRADDPAAIVDVPHFCVEAGHRLVEMQDEGAAQVYIVEKVG